ncbi:multicomponent Na+:H+ antiporter subunit G [Micromonospora nigra]|uniref:Multicomponent Na+:H+ antiporter subunit G n=1 Tax=Micromonospora nigra TaxID=145857 RepID=A0A1C6RFZ3_9ACTN|nr:monovalent cation/H(+) antiporter subunit G [Micromonospora nigra]SCL16075.1 multicomponent Na+:H+ antiporter subunit G [Micromonospora nigra]
MIRVVAGTALLGVGVLLVAISAVGLVRLPDVYNRMNAVAKAASLGLVCVLLGVLLLMPGVRTAVVVLVAVGLQLFTAPVGGYALARAAYRAGAPLAAGTLFHDHDHDHDGPPVAGGGDRPGRPDRPT